MDGQRETTHPWHEEELLLCSGFSLSYKVREGQIEDVYLPGGRRVHIDDLQEWAAQNKVKIYEPYKLRGARGVTRVR
jgi:hypothetical protein